MMLWIVLFPNFKGSLRFQPLIFLGIVVLEVGLKHVGGVFVCSPWRWILEMVVGKKRNQFPFGSQAAANDHFGWPKLATKT